jgi:hypothetical protein
MHLYPLASRPTVASSARISGAFALLAVGADHLQQYAADSYSAIPTIGTLFLLNFVGATVIALGLLAPLPERVHSALALGGIGLAASSLAGLLVSEHGGLFGFVEHGYRSAIVVSIVFEVATLILLTAFVAAGAEEPR